MNKLYIEVEDLKQSFEISSSLSFATNYGHVNEIIKNAQPMIAVSKIQKELNIYNRSDNSAALLTFLNALADLVNPQPELYGGLSVDDWEKLTKLHYVLIETGFIGDMTSEETFLHNNTKDIITRCNSLKLLPDPENHIRYHNGNGINPLPDNIEIEIHYQARDPYKKLSQNVDWSCVFGYRILEVVNDGN